MKNDTIKLFITLLIFILTGCSTITQKFDSQEKYSVNMIIQESSSENKYANPECTFMIKQDKKGNTWGELTSPIISNAVFKGDVKENTSDIEFEINELIFFSNWYNGWTKGNVTVIGKLTFKKNDEVYNCEKKEDLVILEVFEGQIRYFDDYYLGQEGLKKVKDRMDRIFSVVSFLKIEGFTDHFGHFKNKTNQGESFKNLIQPFLFPETKNFKKLYNEKKLPAKYYIEDPSDDSKKKFDWIIGFDMLWEKNYSKKIFPKNLVEIRNSGSMWRDFEEAGGLFFMIYNLDYFYNNLLTSYNFKKIR